MNRLVRRASLLLVLLLAACSTAPPRREVVLPELSGEARNHANNAVLFRAFALVGTPYRYGGNTPETGFDCSGLVAYVFRDAAGVALPRTSLQMSEIGSRRLARGRLHSGDLVFFAGGRKVSHVGIYVGNGQFVHAPNEGGTVRLDNLGSSWWNEHFVYGKRVFE